MLAGTTDPNAYNPYLPVMALFGLPRAFFDLGLLTDPRVWFGVVFLVVFWLALREGGARDPGRWAILVAASPVIAFELAVGGTDVPMVAFLCLGFAYLWVRKPGAGRPRARHRRLDEGDRVAGPAGGRRAARGPRRQAGGRRFTLAALGVVAVCVGPFVVGHPKALVVNTITFPLGLASVKSAARARCPGTSSRRPGRAPGTRSSWRCSRSPGWPSRLSLVFRPPRSVPRAVVLRCDRA